MCATTSRRLDDEQLRKEQLVVANPIEMEGITAERPDQSFEPVIVAEYHLPAGQEVRCSYCPQRTHHQHGLVVRFDPSQLHLIGSVCGPAHLNLHFRHARNQHSELLSRQRYLTRIDAILIRSEMLTAACDEVLFGDQLGDVEAKTSEFRKLAGDTFLRLKSLALAGGALTEASRVRDLGAERRRDERLPKGQVGDPIYRTEMIAIGQLSGKGILHGDMLREPIFKFKQSLGALRSIMKGDTNSIATGKLKRAVLDIEEAREAGNASIATLNSAVWFFNPDHIALLVRWANSNSSDRLENKDGLLTLNGQALHPLPDTPAIGVLPDLYPPESS